MPAPQTTKLEKLLSILFDRYPFRELRAFVVAD